MLCVLIILWNLLFEHIRIVDLGEVLLLSTKTCFYGEI